MGTKNNENGIDTFSWESEDSKNVSKPDEITEVIKDIEEDEFYKEQEFGESEDEKDPDDKFFDNAKKELVDKVLKPKKEKEEKVEKIDSIYNDVYNDFRKEGILKHVEIEEGEKLDAASFYELQQQEYDAEVEEKIKDWVSDLDDDAKQFIKFKREGGNTADFFNFHSKNKEFDVSGDIDDEDYQDYIIRNKLKKDDWDDDVIEDTLRTLSDNGQKYKQAEKFLGKLQKEEEVKKESLFKDLEQKKVYEKQQEAAFNTNLKNVIKETNEINGFRFETRDKEDLYNFLVVQKHKTSSTTGITDFQKSLSEALNDINKVLMIAKLLKNDFNMSDIEKNIKNKSVKEIKSNLEQRKGQRVQNIDSFFND